MISFIIQYVKQLIISFYVPKLTHYILEIQDQYVKYNFYKIQSTY